MKKLFYLLSLSFILISSRPANCEPEIIWKERNIDFSSYDQITVRGIDLRDLQVEAEDYDGELVRESVNEETLIDIANILHSRISFQLRGLVDEVIEAENIDSSKSVLSVIVKVSGLFRYEETGLMQEWLLGGNTEKTDLTIECKLLDFNNEQPIMTFRDNQVFEFSQSYSDDILKNKGDLIALEKLFDAWARKFATTLAKQKYHK